jgi:hypothetical protein
MLLVACPSLPEEGSQLIIPLMVKNFVRYINHPTDYFIYKYNAFDQLYLPIWQKIQFKCSIIASSYAK